MRGGEGREAVTLGSRREQPGAVGERDQERFVLRRTRVAVRPGSGLQSRGEVSGCWRGAAGSRSSSPRRPRRQGLQVACVGIRYEAPDELRALCESFDLVGVAKLGGMIRAFRRRGVRQIVMAGKVTKNVIYTPWRIDPALPGLADDPVVVPQARADNRDDTLLLSVIAEFERDGMDVRLGPRLLPGAARERRHTHPPGADADGAKDIEFGWVMAKEMGRLDVGQSVAVKEKAALAVEAIEGTDRCIERAGQLCRAGGWTLVKVAKPQQDMRFDVPTIGVTTIENLHKAGARVLAIEAEQDDRDRPARGRRPGRPLRHVDRRPAPRLADLTAYNASAQAIGNSE